MPSSYTVQTNLLRRWVSHESTFLGAVSSNPSRVHVWPFLTPGGVDVVEECPADHVIHQGLLVGHDGVNGHNFWQMLDPRYPRNRQELVEEYVETDERGAQFRLVIDWKIESGEAILREERSVGFIRHSDCHDAFIRSTLIAAFGPVHFEQTKEGGIGMRVHPLLSAHFGGRIRDSEGRTGESEIFDNTARWIEVSGSVAGREAGILMAPANDEEPIPWFVRDYGIHMHSPRRHAPLHLEAGQSTSNAVRFLAHDGILEVPELEAMLQRVQSTL